MVESKMKLQEYKEIIPDFDEFMRAMSTPQPYWIRVNTLRISEEALVRRITEKGFVLEKFKNLNAYEIKDMPVKHPGATAEHGLGYYYVQDLASMMPVLALSPRKEEHILDMAAAPGSKTTMIAQIMENTGTLVANDINIGRIKALAGNIERLGITNTIITRKNARNARFGAQFDKILLDAPCTGEGTLRKSPPDKTPTIKEHENFSKMQKSMLENATRHLKSGGTIVYSTCTFNPLENEAVVKYGVTHLGLEPVPVNLPANTEKGVKSWHNFNFEDISDYVARIYPHRVNTGGMFIAILKKQ